MREKHLKIKNWSKGFAGCLHFPFPHFLTRFLEKTKIIEKCFVFFGLLRPVKDFKLCEVPPRTAVLIKEGRKKGITFRALKSPAGFTSYFLMKIDEKSFLIEGLPRAEFLSGPAYELVDDKYKVKKTLEEKGLPTLKGESFWWFQKKKALNFSSRLGFPLVVKPRTGSLGKKVFTNLKNQEEVDAAIEEASKFSPAFLIEKFLPDVSDFRVTIVDFEKVFCFKRITAQVIGDGTHTISQLIQKENQNPKRGKTRTIKTPFYKLVTNKETEKILKEQGFSFSDVPQKEEIVKLQKDPFLRLGGTTTNKVEVAPENIQLFKKIARTFEARVVGIDFLAEDISVPWQKQTCAVLELNSLPGIIGHHFPSSGSPQNVAGAIIEMVLKYYK